MNYTPNTREKLAIIRNNVEMFGLRQTAIDALVHLLRHRDDRFDRDYGVSTRLTSGSVLPLEKGSGEARSLENAHGYEPTDSLVMRHILRHVASRFRLERLSFVDLGCGRGRTLLMAAELPFREVIGVELSAEHCEAASANMAAYRPKRRGWLRRRPKLAPVRICCEDVTKFAYPATDLLVYMFNPFRGSVFESVLDQLAAFQRNQGCKVHIVLSNPAMEDMLLAHPCFERLHEFQVIASGHSWNLWEGTASVRARPSAAALHVGHRS